MIDRSKELSSGQRLFAAVMAVVWIGAGVYGAFRGSTAGPWYLAALSILAVIYGLLWANVFRTGRYGRIPLWL